ncbi:hypothetical protein B0H10DRAFT_2078615 [Mycena sp. CBHHK59/15]|nr:hypothetical protein B0H10DRAFT_2078615 [Mycena sp. CBHHK59/15]
MSIHPLGFSPASPIDGLNSSLKPFLTMGPPPNFRSIGYRDSDRLPASGPTICSASRETHAIDSTSPDPVSCGVPALRPRTFAVNVGQTLHCATCDLCKKSIFAMRYKCLHPDCPDFDLCHSCEILKLHPENHPMLKTRVRLFIHEGAKAYHARAAIDPAAFISGPPSPVHEKHHSARGNGPIPRLLTDRAAAESPSGCALHMRGVWAVSLLYIVFGLTLCINGVGDAVLSLISFIACAGITIAHRTILCATTGATAPKQFMRRFLLIYTWIAPVVLFAFTVLITPSPPVLQCLTPGFLTWSCTPIGINVLFPLTIFAACQWRARQIEKGSTAAGMV